MATITIPTLSSSANAFSIRMVRADNPLKFFGGGEVIIASTEALWAASFTLRPYKMDSDTLAHWKASLIQLSNLENTVELAPPTPNRAGYTGANPLVQGGTQLGLSLIVDGASVSTTIGKRGDYFRVNGEFKMLTADAITDGAGVVTLNFEPALRNTPANNATVDIKTPTFTARLIAPEAGWDERIDGFADIAVGAIETYRP